MIATPAYAGAAFGTIRDGDLSEVTARTAAAEQLGISDQWAWMTQVHGVEVLRVSDAGPAGEADGLMTDVADLPLAVRTADCVPVVIHATDAVAVVHAGWRGMAARAVAGAVEAMTLAGYRPTRAAIGPAIGPCCYEVGDEVVAAFSGRASVTMSGSTSIDLWSEAQSQLAGLAVWRADLCTHCEEHFHSYRATGTSQRQTTVGWL